MESQKARTQAENTSNQVQKEVNLDPFMSLKMLVHKEKVSQSKSKKRKIGEDLPDYPEFSDFPENMMKKKLERGEGLEAPLPPKKATWAHAGLFIPTLRFFWGLRPKEYH